jgi:hypothetical protein
MTAPKMTRKRALELAQECIAKEMQKYYYDAISTFDNKDIRVVKNTDKYAELAAALQVIEYMSRQKEMQL